MTDYPILCPNCNRGYLKTTSLALDKIAWQCENCYKIFNDPVGIKEILTEFNPSRRYQ